MEPEEIKNETLEKYKKYINPSLARIFKISGSDQVEWESRGTEIKTVDGKKYIDCLGGYGVFSLGHSHPKVIKAVKEQLGKMPLSSKLFLNKPLADLSELLAKITPGDLQYSFVCNSGAEAIEGAIKLARLHTKKSKIISAINAFHGKTLGALSVSGREIYKKPFYPLLPDCLQVPFGDAEAVKKEIDANTAAVLLEPIQGEGGIVVPPPNYLKEVRKICTERDVLLILDEIQTGMGRCGEMFACEYEKVVPDIMTLAKALGGGIMPVGAFIASEKVYRSFFPNPLIHTSTFGGNLLACVSAIAAINVTIEEELPKKARENGSYFMSKLSELKDEYPDVISVVRGRGLLIGVELKREALGGVTLSEMLKRNVLVAYTLNNPKVMRFEPPLIITREEIDLVLQRFKESLEKANAIVGRLEEK